jgi:hypothetical protein
MNIKDFEILKEDKIEIQAEQQQRKEIKLIGSQRKIGGLTLWEFNFKDKTLSPAEYSKVNYELKSLSSVDQDMIVKHRVITKEHCQYFQALNRKNALKKIKKAGYSI